jgi:hypothetical protein
MRFHFQLSRFDQAVSAKVIDTFLVDGEPVGKVIEAVTGPNGFVKHMDTPIRLTPCRTDAIKHIKRGHVTIKRYNLTTCAYNLISEFFSFIGSIPSRIRLKLILLRH